MYETTELRNCHLTLQAIVITSFTFSPRGIIRIQAIQSNMKLNVAASILFAVTLAVASSSSVVDAETIRGGNWKSSSSVVVPTTGLKKYALIAEETKKVLRRQLEEDGDENNEDEDEEDENENDDEDEEDEEENNDENEDEDEDEEENEYDNYVYYDDEALQNCDDDDEECQKVAAYVAYDEEALANCEDDDEECQNAAAYMNAKQAMEEGNSASGWKSWTDFDSMSKSSKIWTIVLGVWFALLGIATCIFCLPCCLCCGYVKSTKGKDGAERRSTKKSLKQSLLGATGSGSVVSSRSTKSKNKNKNHRGSSASPTSDQQQEQQIDHGSNGENNTNTEGKSRKKFRIFGRKKSSPVEE